MKKFEFPHFFVIRAKKSRNVIYNGQTCNIMDVALRHKGAYRMDETYRAEHSEYNAANMVSYVQSFGTPSSGASASGSASSGTGSSVDHTCRTCVGTGSCKKCYGSGGITNSYSGKLQSCMRCQGSGKCAICAGTGTVN